MNYGLCSKNTLEPNEEEIETFEEYNPSTLTDSAKAKTEYQDKIIILDSAMKSARQSTFKPPLGFGKLLALVGSYNVQIKNSL